jgi:dolichol-phosphate mannosyltransferase
MLPPASNSLLVVIPTYNEVNSLPNLVQRILQLLPEAHLLVIDDSSPDGTGQWAADLSNNEVRLNVIHRPGKSGLGTASLLGLRKAMTDQYPLVATIDADGSHRPEDLDAMVRMLLSEPASEAGVVIGSRYVPGGGIIGWPWQRRWSSRLVNGYARVLLRLKTKDNTSALRVYRTSALRRIELNSIKSRGYSYLEEILFRLNRAGIKMLEFPIQFQNRQSGRSKVNPIEVLGSFTQLLKLTFR